MKSKGIIAAVIAVVALAGGLVWWQVSKSTMLPAPGPSDVSGQPSAGGTPTVGLKDDPKLGSYLVDGQGRTLYFFAKDGNGQSACAGACLSAWPVFHPDAVTLGSGLDEGDFASITRPDGSSQTTYYGLPLYYYAQDAAPGDIKGEGVNKLWYVAKPDYTVLFFNKDGRNYLADAESGLALYQFSKDGSDASACTGTCLQNWPAFGAEKIVAPSFIDASRFGGFTRSDAAHQASFDHHPLYRYVQDKVRGDMKGQDVGGVWSTVDPFGSATASGAVGLDIGEKDKGTTVQATQGQIVTLTLHSTYWIIQGPDPKILKPLSAQPEVSADFKGVPGSGSGTVVMRYQAVGTGTATIAASRTTCGEAMGCTGDAGSFKVDVKVGM